MLTAYRIDNEHSNSYEVWKKMGSPQNPTAEQIANWKKQGSYKLKVSQEKAEVKNEK